MTDIHGIEPPGLDLALEPDRERVIVRPLGEIDIANVHLLDAEVQELLDRGFDALVVDLSDVTFIDVRGVRLILELSQRMGPALSVVPGPPSVQRAFEVCGLTAVIPFATPRRRFH
jgi:anti-sigma B factor antagonist